jgi:general secretion pathway protein G
MPLDPWGREYIYEYPSRKNSKYDLYTLGADGIEGGSGEDADVGNWMEQ